MRILWTLPVACTAGNSNAWQYRSNLYHSILKDNKATQEQAPVRMQLSAASGA